MPSTLKIGSKTVKIIKTISEGGYGFVYLAEDTKTPNQQYALKKVIAQNEDRLKVTMKELNFLKDYCQNPNSSFIRYYDSSVAKTGKNEHTVHILLEVADKGTLFDIMANHLENKKTFVEDQIITIARSITKALVKLHSLEYVYCDLKIENCLFFDWTDVRLCDFGSVNNFDLNFATIEKDSYYKYEEIFEKETTLMYRPPEMCDPYLKYKVNQKADMWMLGCVLYTLMFFKHPFFSCSKLAITIASYNWPETPTYSKNLENLIRNLLTPVPDLRPSSKDVERILNNWGSQNIELNNLALEIRNEKMRKLNTLKSIGGSKEVNFYGKEKGGFDEFDFSGLNKISNKGKQVKASKKANMWNMESNEQKTNEFDIFNNAVSKEEGDFGMFNFETTEDKLEYKKEDQFYEFGKANKQKKEEELKEDFDNFMDLGCFMEGGNKPAEKKKVGNNDPDFLSF